MARPRDQDKEAQILEAATALMAVEGFHAMTVPAVAKRAGVGLGTLYRRFDGKDALANAVFRRAKRAWARWTLEEWPVGDSARAQFQTYWSRLRAFAEGARDEALCAERLPEGFELDAPSKALRGELEARTTAVLGGWLQAPQMAPLDIGVVEALVHGTFWRVMALPVSEERRETLLDQAREAVWRALSRPAPA